MVNDESMPPRYTREDYDEITRLLGRSLRIDQAFSELLKCRDDGYDNFPVILKLRKALGCPLEDVPLLVNEADRDLKIIADWRLKRGI